MGRLIDADKLSADMYHEAFEKDSDMQKWDSGCWIRYKMFENALKAQPTIEPERKTGHWILDRSGAYCCNNCMEPCATYVMMKPRDRFCKMCGSRNEVTE